MLTISSLSWLLYIRHFIILKAFQQWPTIPNKSIHSSQGKYFRDARCSVQALRVWLYLHWGIDTHLSSKSCETLKGGNAATFKAHASDFSRGEHGTSWYGKIARICKWPAFTLVVALGLSFRGKQALVSQSILTVHVRCDHSWRRSHFGEYI